MALLPRQLEILIHRGWRSRWIRIFNWRGVSAVFRPKGHVWHFYSMKLPIQETCIQTLVSTGQYFQCKSQSDCKYPHHHWIKQKRLYSTSCRRVGYKPWEGSYFIVLHAKKPCVLAFAFCFCSDCHIGCYGERCAPQIIPRSWTNHVGALPQLSHLIPYHWT